MYNRSSYYAIDSYDNVFYLKSDLEKVFLVGPDGERDRKNGKPGYKAGRSIWNRGRSSGRDTPLSKP